MVRRRRQWHRASVSVEPVSGRNIVAAGDRWTVDLIRDSDKLGMFLGTLGLLPLNRSTKPCTLCLYRSVVLVSNVLEHCVVNPIDVITHTSHLPRRLHLLLSLGAVVIGIWLSITQVLDVMFVDKQKVFQFRMGSRNLWKRAKVDLLHSRLMDHMGQIMLEGTIFAWVGTAIWTVVYGIGFLVWFVGVDRLGGWSAVTWRLVLIVTGSIGSQTTALSLIIVMATRAMYHSRCLRAIRAALRNGTVSLEEAVTLHNTVREAVKITNREIGAAPYVFGIGGCYVTAAVGALALQVLIVNNVTVWAAAWLLMLAVFPLILLLPVTLRLSAVAEQDDATREFLGEDVRCTLMLQLQHERQVVAGDRQPFTAATSANARRDVRPIFRATKQQSQQQQPMDQSHDAKPGRDISASASRGARDATAGVEAPDPSTIRRTRNEETKTNTMTAEPDTEHADAKHIATAATTTSTTTAAHAGAGGRPRSNTDSGATDTRLAPQLSGSTPEQGIFSSSSAGRGELSSLPAHLRASGATPQQIDLLENSMGTLPSVHGLHSPTAAGTPFTAPNPNNDHGTGEPDDVEEKGSDGEERSTAGGQAKAVADADHHAPHIPARAASGMSLHSVSSVGSVQADAGPDLGTGRAEASTRSGVALDMQQLREGSGANDDRHGDDDTGGDDAAPTLVTPAASNNIGVLDRAIPAMSGSPPSRTADRTAHSTRPLLADHVSRSGEDTLSQTLFTTDRAVPEADAKDTRPLAADTEAEERNRGKHAATITATTASNEKKPTGSHEGHAADSERHMSKSIICVPTCSYGVHLARTPADARRNVEILEERLEILEHFVQYVVSAALCIRILGIPMRRDVMIKAYYLVALIFLWILRSQFTWDLEEAVQSDRCDD